MFKIPKLDPLRALASLFYPSLCSICSAPVDDREYVCEPCSRKAPRITPPFCAKCSEPFHGAITDSFACANCSHRTLHFDSAVASYRSRGIVRKLVHEFKYGKQLHLRHAVADWLLESLDDPRLRGRRFDIVVPVPLHPARKRERGFNQAELLARGVAEKMKATVSDTLEVVRSTRDQVELSAAQRRANVAGAYAATKPLRGTILLVDDVFTTGATMSACSATLLRAGAEEVHALTLCRTV